MSPADWRVALASLESRLAALPDAIVDTATGDGVPDLRDARGARRVVTTGIGSSEAHARFLAWVLDQHADVRARFLPPGALATPPPGAADDVLVVCSQGLSPNARVVLDAAPAWRRVLLLTAATAAGTPDAAKRRVLNALGANVVRYAGEGEYGTLLRVTGPVAGYVAAWRLARALAGGTALPPLDASRLARAVKDAVGRAATLPVSPDVGSMLAHAQLVTTGGYDELVHNLRYQVMEGLLLPAPPVWDVLNVAHGPFQQSFPGPATFVALARSDAPGEAALLERLGALLVPGRHRLLSLVATLPGALAILEHETLMLALVLRGIRERGLDQADWPGRGSDAPLYALSCVPGADAFAARTWRETGADTRRTAVVPLGATEQHGLHLPLATDTWIADALAERLCARVGDAVHVPALALGCSAEHAAFPGTLDLRPTTLAAVLTDVVTALARDGCGRVFVFSAHGGNVGALRDAAPALRAAAAPALVDVFTDLAAVTAALHAVARADGVSAEAAGHHAGEVETSMVLALRPHAVRSAALAPGYVAPTSDSQALFYPNLRSHAPDGTVGDPRAADAARGVRYLDAWTDVLEGAYRAAKNPPAPTGSQNA